MKHYSITQAGLISLFAFVVGQVVAFVPSIANDQQTLISAGSSLIALGFLVANAIHAHASTAAQQAPVAAQPLGLVDPGLVAPASAPVASPAVAPPAA